MTNTPSRRLSAEDWILAGFRALARSGPSALKAEALARELATTKGSFYWHFKDLPDYLSRMIAFWEARAFDAVIAGLNSMAPPYERLRALCLLAAGARDPVYGGLALEPALRAWALSAPNVAKAVARMDARRLQYLTALCREADITTPNAPEMLYALSVGMAAVQPEGATNAMQTLLDLLR